MSTKSFKRAAPAPTADAVEQNIPKKIKFSHDDDDDEQVEESKADNEGQETTATSTEKAPKKKRKNKGAAKKAVKKAERLALAQKEKEERLANGGPEKLPTPRDLAREYLTLWSNDRKTWKFNKARQLWILRHLLDTWNVADDVFTIAVKYCKDLPEGNSRTVTLDQMKEIIVKGVTLKEDVEEEPEKEDEKEAKPEKEGDKPKNRKVKVDPKALKKNQITEEMFQRAWKLVKVLEKKEKK
ncbi:UNVERIFIED_CONTAM: hypothetical protein HDU68_000654 [Siphonaria sp. JEL0065]|nr:hypothetical protein HDU68_000654 [Siphonaria sp. JEL0065]